jgi:radical SAM-linked protein
MVTHGMASDKVRIRFRKAGDLRLVSHHDLLRCWERMLRRAAIPFHSTGGFNPKPRLVFALSLALGIVGCAEVVELELNEPVDPDQLADQLRQQAPAGLEILDVHRIEPKLTAHVRRVTYRIDVPEARTAALTQATAELLGRAELWVDRERPQRRRVNLRPYLDAFRINPTSLEMDLWVTPNGTARPDELLELLGLGDLLTDGAILERRTIELEDETGPAPTLPSPTAAAQEHEIARQRALPPGPKPAAADQGPHPLIPGPLDY